MIVKYPGVLCAAVIVLAATRTPATAEAKSVASAMSPEPGDAASAAAHTRITTARGPIHVWTPPGHDPATRRLVVYVHGYYTDVDHAWSEHALADQFAASGLDAIYIACEAPAGHNEVIRWPSLGAMLRTVRKRVALPRRPEVIVVAHSGGYWTLRSWLLLGARIDSIVLLDGVYDAAPELRRWVRQRRHRLYDVVDLTRDGADALHANMRGTAVLDELPDSAEAWHEATGGARIVYAHSQFAHMPMVTDGQVIPMLLGTFGSDLDDDPAP